VFGQNVTEHNPAPSPSGLPLLRDIRQIFTPKLLRLNCSSRQRGLLTAMACYAPLPVACRSSQSSSSTSYDDFDDDAWADFDLSGAIEQHQRGSGSQPTAATAGAATTSLRTDGISRDQEWLDITGTELRCGELMKVVASAGAGKSTVLREYAALRPHLRCLYLTFNKEVREEKQAEFSGAGLWHVTVKTVNSLAWGPTRPYHQGVLSFGDFFLNAAHLEQLAPRRGASPSTDDAEAIKAALCCFCASTDAEVGRKHFPGKSLAKDAARLVGLAPKVRSLPLAPFRTPPPPLSAHPHALHTHLYPPHPLPLAPPPPITALRVPTPHPRRPTPHLSAWCDRSGRR
jgi:F-box protein 18 (helicase)